MKKLLFVGFAFAIGASVEALAYDNIIRPYQSIRSSAMGGAFVTTGLYEQNFFGNPARITANPHNRLTILDPMVEVGSNTISNVGNLATSSGDTVQKIANSTGSDNHVRIQTSMPALYIAPGEDGNWGYAFALLTSIQADVAPRQDYQINTLGVLDVGPAITVGRKLLEDKSLSVGATTHATYRISTRQAVSIADVISGSSLGTQQSAGEGGMIDFDLGGYYTTPIQFNEFKVVTGASLNNLLGGNYANLGMHPFNLNAFSPLQQPRALNIGAGLKRASLGPFTDFMASLETTDIGNNSNGSLFRTVHLGGESRYGHLLVRGGVNQGYLTAGVAFDTRVFELELTTYGEELSLNVGSARLEDRRYAIRFAFQL